MANLDTTWPHLPAHAPAPALWPCPAWFSPAAAAFENDALASALAHASASASPSSPTPSSSTTTTTTSSASELSSVPYDVPPAHAQPATCRPVPAPRQCTGRVSKRKPRPSRRPPTTYITADPADFRRMVQKITGFNVPGAAERAYPAAAPRRPEPLAFVLPTLDTSACFMLDQPPFPPPPQQQRWEDNTSSGAATGMAAAAGDGADEPSLLLMHELEAMMSAPGAASGFPTLESWGII
nr:calmodulin-binding protein 25-like [Lolium perenne]